MRLIVRVQTLNVSRAEAEGLVVSLILDDRIKGKIDQVNGLLVLDRLSVEVVTQYSCTNHAQ